MKKVEARMQNENAPRRGLRYFRILPSAFFIFLVRIYQLVLSPAKNVVLGPAGYCRFEPSCSQYAVEALKTHGAVSGSWLAAKRICRCHPWGAYGEDPVPPIKAGTSRGDVPVRVERTEPASEKATPLARLNAARTSQRAVPATAELPVSSVGFL